MNKTKSKESEPEISAPEDLMREHGVLNRILLIYVEDYQEQLGEKFFPRFDRGHSLAGLVTVLKEQHQAGRRLTDTVLRNAMGARLMSADGRRDVVRACDAFIRMYRPHEAPEDTVLFPALYKVVPAKEIVSTTSRGSRRNHERCHVTRAVAPRHA